MGQTYNIDILTSDGSQVVRQGELNYTDSNPLTPAPLNATSPVGTITSGALPTVTLASGTGAQVSTARDVNLYVPLTSSGTNAVATCALAISPDNSTYTTVGTVTLAAAVNTIGAVVIVETLRIPAGWYVKLTASNFTIGSAGVCSYA